MKAAPATAGVYPVNHTASLESVVPVFPACGYPPGMRAGAPVPFMTPLSTSLTPSATWVLMTRLQLASGTLRFWPSLFLIDLTMIGSQCTPRAAKVAYELAIDSGVTYAVPRVNEGIAPYSLTMSLPLASSTPVFLAIFVTLHRPASRSSWTKYVLTEYAAAVRSPMVPECPVELDTEKGPDRTFPLHPWKVSPVKSMGEPA